MTFFNRLLAVSVGFASLFSYNSFAQPVKRIVHPLEFSQVKIDDGFWSPKLKVWTKVTVYDVFDKLEGHYEPDRPDIIAEKKKLGRTRNAFMNFDLVAQGKKNIGVHDGPPWYDGLVYETIRGAADLLAEHPDPELEKKIDGYIDRIAAAQNADPDGYLNTYTTLTYTNKRWGANGGNDRWQHDLYNAGMLVEAAVHYYKATGKTKLLDVAVRFSNYMAKEMGPSPKKNIIPGHGGPEEALIKLYWLFKEKPELKKKMSVKVDEKEYFRLAKFWIENRGIHSDPDGSNKRENLGAYNQDSVQVFDQPTIEGHAVRATLLATGVASAALESKDPRYIQTANRFWDNMAGKKMFITGGEGAISYDEKFGPDYYLPESAYGETCAAISAGFFSTRMNELEGDGKYIDEFERVLYNNFLSGVSLSGDHFFYENPLIGNGNKRWAWHDCPCCPPMILKMIGILPQYIYGDDGEQLYVNLFIGSEADLKIKGQQVMIKQTTGYPWKGNVRLEINPQGNKSFAIKVRIPGWAEKKENAYDLYHSNVDGKPMLKVNGTLVPLTTTDGYATITRKWKKGDVVELSLPMAPRLVSPNEAVKTIENKLSIASGPIVYGFETIDNPDLGDYRLNPGIPLTLTYKPALLNGVNVISGQLTGKQGKPVNFTAIPFFALGNREPGSPYRIWLQQKN
ncbi:glycoside hydrolase family 127 protein [Mucilaginibacter defluvii]|uniref:Glycoside hydrolase family 127 protein n=1 Tax=Mucilaginibacter defluvii TaxID=1196019 RepID=A0ABP9G7X3_9SPHI